MPMRRAARRIASSRSSVPRSSSSQSGCANTPSRTLARRSSSSNTLAMMAAGSQRTTTPPRSKMRFKAGDAATTAAPISRQPTVFIPGCMMSAVRVAGCERSGSPAPARLLRCIFPPQERRDLLRRKGSRSVKRRCPRGHEVAEVRGSFSSPYILVTWQAERHAGEHAARQDVDQHRGREDHVNCRRRAATTLHGTLRRRHGRPAPVGRDRLAVLARHRASCPRRHAWSTCP